MGATKQIQNSLSKYLGTYSYTQGSADKYFRVVPLMENGLATARYRITWGADPNQLDSPKRVTVVEAPEAFRRIRSKVRGGYTQIEKYSGSIHESALMTVTDLFPKAYTKPSKKSKEKKGSSFLDWLKER